MLKLIDSEVVCVSLSNGISNALPDNVDLGKIHFNETLSLSLSFVIKNRNSRTKTRTLFSNLTNGLQINSMLSSRSTFESRKSKLELTAYQWKAFEILNFNLPILNF